MDNLTRAQRSATMALVRSRNTRPEIAVRRIIKSLGYRFQSHRADLPGKPDFVLSRKRKAIFVHGCFWHGHSCRAGTNRPSSNQAYWGAKLAGNERRDSKSRASLRRMGWRTMVVWECQIGNHERLRSRIEHFLES